LIEVFILLEEYLEVLVIQETIEGHFQFERKMIDLISKFDLKL